MLDVRDCEREWEAACRVDMPTGSDGPSSNICLTGVGTLVLRYASLSAFMGMSSAVAREDCDRRDLCTTGAVDGWKDASTGSSSFNKIDFILVRPEKGPFVMPGAGA